MRPVSSCARRTGTERTFSTTKDPASNDISRGWCRLTGLAPIAQFAAWPDYAQLGLARRPGPGRANILPAQGP